MKRLFKVTLFLLCASLLVSCFDSANGDKGDGGKDNSNTVTKPDPVLTAIEKPINVYRDLLPEISAEGLPYRVYYPMDYDEKYAYPLLVFLHGAGERGDDNELQLKNMMQDLFDDTESPIYQSIVIVPQCPAGEQWVNTPWEDGSYDLDTVGESDSLQRVVALIEEICKRDSVNRDRIYAYGLSMGGYGTWNLLMNHSDLFAAGVPICGGADPSKAEILKDIPIYTFHGTVDPTVPFEGTKEVVDAIIAAGGTKILYEWGEGVGHGIWNQVAKRPDVIRWLFEQRRGAE